MKAIACFVVVSFVVAVVAQTVAGQSSSGQPIVIVEGDGTIIDKSIFKKPTTATVESTKPKKFVPEVPVVATFAPGNVERRAASGRVRDYGVASDYPRTDPARSAIGRRRK